MKVTFKLFATILFIGLFSACINDDEGTETPEPSPIERGDVEVNRFEITFTPKSGGGASKTFEFNDPDGLGGNPPVTNDIWKLDYSRSGGIKTYDAEIKFFNGNVEVTDQIESKPSNYIVCYRGMNTQDLRLNDSNLDDNGLRLGTITTWQVLHVFGSAGQNKGNLKISLNYIHLRKEGICDAGVRIFESSLNYEHQ